MWESSSHELNSKRDSGLGRRRFRTTEALFENIGKDLEAEFGAQWREKLARNTQVKP